MNRNFRKSIASITLLGTVLVGGATAAHAQTSTSTATTATTAKAAPPQGQPGKGGFAYHAATIAKLLGTTTADLDTAMKTKSLAAIAAEKGVAVQSIIDAYVAEEQVEHPTMAAADIVARVTNMVNNVRPARPADGTRPARAADGTRPARGSRTASGSATTVTTVKA